MSNSKQGGKASGAPSGRMTMDEYKQLGGLLQKARDEKRLGEIMVFANVERETLEQLQRYQQPIVMPKSKARTAQPSMATGSVDGSMTDASKRRFSEHEVEPTIEEALEEFDVVQSIEAFDRTGGMDGLPLMNGPMLSAASHEADAAASVMGQLGSAPMTHYAVQGDYLRGRPDTSNSWFPQMDPECQDVAIKIPDEYIDTPSTWGRNVIKMEKYKNKRWTYEQAVRMALGGVSEVATYCQYIMDHHSKTYLEQGSKTQAADFAGFLMRHRVKVIKIPQYTGFRRELA